MMLARIANSLFWMGRYLERAQHTSRYVNVHFFAALDAPVLTKKEFVFDSIISMTGVNSIQPFDSLSEKELIFLVALGQTNPVSIQASIFNARENARGARDVLSGELWESINRFYHSVNEYSTEGKLTEEEILNFTRMVVENCSIVNGYIDHSLNHDHSWSMIQLGMRIEAASQITRILMSKLADIQKAKNIMNGGSLETFQNITLLKSAEAFDMSRIHYRSVPKISDSLDFLIFNENFPRSILFNLHHIHQHLQGLGLEDEKISDDAFFYSGKLYSTLKYRLIEEIEDNIYPFLVKKLGDLYRLADLIEKKIS